MYLIWATYIHVFKEKSDIISLLVTIVICDCIIARSKTSIKRVVGCPSVVFSWCVISHNCFPWNASHNILSSWIVKDIDSWCATLLLQMYFLRDLWLILFSLKFNGLRIQRNRIIWFYLCRHYSLCIRGKLYLTDCAFYSIGERVQQIKAQTTQVCITISHYVIDYAPLWFSLSILLASVNK
jgi:hypothetical protein